MTDTLSSSKPLPRLAALLITVIVLVIVGAFFLNMPDRRTPSEKLGDAAQTLSNGVRDAGRTLQNRTPAEKASDAARDMGDRIKSPSQ